MTKKQTGQVADSNLLDGTKQYLVKARKALPYLIRQAKAGQTIYYSDLASEIEMKSARNLNYVLGAIGNALISLAKRTNKEIPPIQYLVINKRQELPGEGIGWFISQTDFSKLGKTQKEKVITTQLTKIYAFQHWDWVLSQFKLDPVPTNLGDELKKAKSKRGGGEGQQHKKFKKFISFNPKALGLSAKLENGEQEYVLPSLDKIDVMFIDKEIIIGVEVKSRISDTSDILRGLFQCVKYKYLIEAEQTVNDKVPNSKVILALEGRFPNKLVLAKNLLGIEVIDGIKTND